MANAILDPELESVELSIIFPCLNEAETIGDCILLAQAFLAENEVHGEIIVGDSGSSDTSRKVAADLGARVFVAPDRGYGLALTTAMKQARGRFFIMADSDGSYDLGALKEFLENLRRGYDLVMGNRFSGTIHPRAMPWMNRYVGNPLLTSIGRLFFRTPVRDFHCGIRGLSREAFERFDLRSTGMEFASEMVIKASLVGARVTEIPTVLKPAGRTKPSHLRPVRDGFRHIFLMLMIFMRVGHGK